jgi:hypothetical protein
MADRANEIESLELREVEAILKHDLETLKDLWSDELVVATNVNLIFTKHQLFGLFQAGLVELESLARTFSKSSIRENVGIVIGNEAAVSRIGQQAGHTVLSSYLSTWTRENDVWRLAARHSATIGIDRQ